MHKNNLFSNLDSLKFKSTSHNIGEKFIFFREDELQSPLTQIAIGKLKPEEVVPFHIHKSMEEVFFILSGKGIFSIGDEQFNINKNCCIRVPCGFSHSIKAETDLQFYYFGVATN
jgi:mannose-6-phosphate isomerase-like protein (cupin superfamily)